jgi:hypothetical protein
VAAEVGGAPFGSLDEALGSGTPIDAAVIATPTFTHRDLAVEALGAGLHVFCEKPMALTSQECDDMIAAAERAGRVLQIGYVRRFQPEFVEASARIESGEIGDVMLVKSLTRGPGLPPPWAHDLALSNGIAGGGQQPLLRQRPVAGGRRHRAPSTPRSPTARARGSESRRSTSTTTRSFPCASPTTRSARSTGSARPATATTPAWRWSGRRACS